MPAGELRVGSCANLTVLNVEAYGPFLRIFAYSQEELERMRNLLEDNGLDQKPVPSRVDLGSFQVSRGTCFVKYDGAYNRAVILQVEPDSVLAEPDYVLVELTDFHRVKRVKQQQIRLPSPELRANNDLVFQIVISHMLVLGGVRSRAKEWSPKVLQIAQSHVLEKTGVARVVHENEWGKIAKFTVDAKDIAETLAEVKISVEG